MKPSGVAETSAAPLGERGTREPELSVVIPCLNEAESIEIVVRKAVETMAAAGIDGEVLVADNGSTDRSPELAREAGARVVIRAAPRLRIRVPGGLRRRARHLRADGRRRRQLRLRRDPALPRAAPRRGRHGDRQPDGGHPGPGRCRGFTATSAIPLLTGTLNLFFHTGVSDAHCGMRAFRRDLLPRLDLRTTGMEFASEWVIRASKLGLEVREIPISYHPRKGESKLSSFSDGWRHLRFLLIHSPTWLFLLPGALLALAGTLGMVVVLTGIELFGREWEFHALIASVASLIVGAQILQIGIFARAFALYYLGEHDSLIDCARRQPAARARDRRRRRSCSRSASSSPRSSSSPGSIAASARSARSASRSSASP